MSDLITIVVPVYKSAKYLRRCIDSVTAQTYPYFELLLIDDGSPDDSGTICDEAARTDQRINVIHNQNQGVSMARNAGIELAKGKYIVFCDSDDVLDSDYLQELYLKAEGNPEHLSVCWLKILSDKTDKVAISKIENEAIPLKNFALMFNSKLLSSPCNKLYRMDIIQNNKLKFNTYFSIGEDTLFNLGYIRHITGFSIVHKPLYIYYQKSNEGLNCACDFNRLIALEAMHHKLMELVNYLGSDENMKFFIRKNILEAYALGIRRYTMDGYDKLPEKLKTLKRVFDSKEYNDALLALDDIDTTKPLRQLLKKKSPYLTLIYFKLARLKRNLLTKGR